MSRTVRLFPICALALVFCLPGHTQDSPSLGDLARQAQKDKGNVPAAKVITNDDLAPGSGSDASGFGAGLGQIIQPGAPGKPGTAPSPADQLARLESVFDKLDSIDRATLAKNVLEGANVDFPGRSKWEEKLFAAKQVFVVEGRDLIKRAEQINASAKSIQDVHDPNDPRVKTLSNQLQRLMEDGVRIGGTFQGVIEEGKDLASQSTSH
jgi:hypothetical protein